MSRYEGKYLSEERSRKPRRRRRRRNYLPLILVLVLVTVAAIVLGFTMGRDDLKGQWLYGNTVYSFDGKGKGNMELPDEAYTYTYEFKGRSLSLDFEDDRLSDPSYTVDLNGDVLTLTGSGDMGSVKYELIKIEK